MKKLLAMAVVAAMISCKQETKETTAQVETKTEDKNIIKPITNEVLETAVIYEANIRQYSKEGTFDAFTKDIPQLKELGVKIIWLMPVFPISETKRKATGGKDSKFASEFPEEERAKYLGSYYAVSDFKKINPEFGTIEDFRKLVKTAHDNGIYVILDWVPNHTGWDHTWLITNSDFYTKNENGEVIHPDGTDWTDVADLNYDNPELRKEMISDMSYWITKENIDGFRCDVAGSVPTSFWHEAVPELRKLKDIFMLAEAWEPELLEGNLFDMAYGWDRHHTMNHIAKGEEKVAAWHTNYEKDAKRYATDDILMTFVTNHDENSWNGTIEERMGESAGLFTTLSYLVPGMPLIYSGQEYGLNHRLKFFEKDSIPKTKGKEWSLLKKLASLKQGNSALNGGKESAAYKTLEVNNENVLAFTRSKADDAIVFIGNLSKEKQSVTIQIDGNFTDYNSGNKVSLKSKESIELKPWEFYVLTK
ncbi:alpha-amlyase [Tenacibaculum sp. SZ-18]|uniref:alpha-amylase family glycosyl hydrolase n=1 Tax=Tenacibaculum sp. SZ-18 TaxID=754423 RepID=UPI000C2D0393|nr:alpha-amylase family glycosyl hydrolase [Tenacibaculum sp. SZ-18]AUC14904.1 alpha-amlyase [Tenacibaculum sp. SZ-18]